MIEGQKGAPTQKQISKAAADRWSGYTEDVKKNYEKKAKQKEPPNIVAIDCSDSESDTKKGQKIKPRLKKDYIKQQNKQAPEISR
jgi:hypothetical protein